MDYFQNIEKSNSYKKDKEKTIEFYGSNAILKNIYQQNKEYDINECYYQMRFTLFFTNYESIIKSISKMMQKVQKEKQIYNNLSHINFLALEALQSSLEDRITLNAYIQAITQNQSEFTNKIVLHITTGCNCLYSILAAQMGASKVYCVVNGHSEIERKNVYMMNKIVKENEYDNIIQVKYFKDFNAEVEIIIGEPMGYNMIYDGMLDRMIQARDLYMKNREKGLMFPNKLRYKCAFIRDECFFIKKMQFWNEVYGVPMLTMKNWISHEPIVRLVDPLLIVSEAVKFIDIDLMNASYEEIDSINKKFVVKTPTECFANGLSIWFQLQFQKADGQKIEVKASPWCETTKWAQMTLYSKNEWELKAGGSKMVQFIGKKNHIQGSTSIKLRVDENGQQIYRFS